MQYGDSTVGQVSEIGARNIAEVTHKHSATIACNIHAISRLVPRALVCHTLKLVLYFCNIARNNFRELTYRTISGLRAILRVMLYGISKPLVCTKKEYNTRGPLVI